MKKEILVTMCCLSLAVPALSFAGEKGEKQEPHPNVSAYEHADEKAGFRRSWWPFNNRANKEMRAKRLAERVETKKKIEKAQDKGEGQVKVKF